MVVDDAIDQVPGLVKRHALLVRKRYQREFLGISHAREVALGTSSVTGTMSRHI